MSDTEDDLSSARSKSDDGKVNKKPKATKKASPVKKTTKNKKENKKETKTKKNTKKEKDTKKKKKEVKKDKKSQKKSKKESVKKEKKTTRVKKVKEEKDIDSKLEPTSSFSKPGQRYMTPPQGDATRGFYESLYEENPNSLIAIKFCVEYGVFGGHKLTEVLSKYTLLQKNGHFKGTTGAIKPSAISFLQKHAPAIKAQSA